MSYRDHALTYFDKGWRGVIPVPAETKQPPPAGFTGICGIDTTRERIETWCRERPNYSIALRMPTDVIGIDTDHYDNKRGGDTLAAHDEKWGERPATWRSSARPAPSGIYYYRVPAGTRFVSEIQPAIEIIQHRHRYAMVPWSAHKLGTYRWYRPDGTPGDLGEVPNPNDLPPLPARWVAGLTYAGKDEYAAVTGADAAAMWAAITDDDRTPCQRMAAMAARAVRLLRAAESSGSSRHDEALRQTRHVVGLAAEGHPGFAAVNDLMRDAWGQVTGGGREFEWDSLVDGAVAIATGKRRAELAND